MESTQETALEQEYHRQVNRQLDKKGEILYITTKKEGDLEYTMFVYSWGKVMIPVPESLRQ